MGVRVPPSAPRTQSAGLALSHVFLDVLCQYFVDQCLIGDAPALGLLAELLEHTYVQANRDESPRLVCDRWAPPTLLIAFSCSGDESGISERSILRDVRRALLPIPLCGPACASSIANGIQESLVPRKCR